MHETIVLMPMQLRTYQCSLLELNLYICTILFCLAENELIFAEDGTVNKRPSTAYYAGIAVCRSFERKSCNRLIFLSVGCIV